MFFIWNYFVTKLNRRLITAEDPMTFDVAQVVPTFFDNRQNFPRILVNIESRHEPRFVKEGLGRTAERPLGFSSDSSGLDEF